MSGPGGGGGGGGGVPPPTGVDCLRLVIRTTLNSPNPKVVAKLKKNDQLAIEAQGERGPVVAKDSGGNIAGTVTGQELLDLLRCIADGFEYIAIVREISGGKVDVEIRPKSK